jgi:SAM-dependent methyltransferase
VPERRLLFGEVADLYDRHRPAYPDRLVEDVISIAQLDGSHTALEVGAGTGKATSMFASRGIPVLAVEPSTEMASLARRNCQGLPVVIEESDFELWNPRGRRFALLFSAQAWHWVKPELGYPKARETLLTRGVLAAFWNRVQWAGCEQREQLLVAFAEAAPELSPDGVMHPANLCPDADEDWHGEIAAAEGFAEAEIRDYARDERYSASEFVGLLATISEIRLLNASSRSALLSAVADVIRASGEPLTLAMRTRLCLARRA